MKKIWRTEYWKEEKLTFFQAPSIKILCWREIKLNDKREPQDCGSYLLCTKNRQYFYHDILYAEWLRYSTSSPIIVKGVKKKGIKFLFLS